MAGSNRQMNCPDGRQRGENRPGRYQTDDFSAAQRRTQYPPSRIPVASGSRRLGDACAGAFRPPNQGGPTAQVRGVAGVSRPPARMPPPSAQSRLCDAVRNEALGRPLTATRSQIPRGGNAAPSRPVGARRPAAEDCAPQNRAQISTRVNVNTTMTRNPQQQVDQPNGNMRALNQTRSMQRTPRFFGQAANSTFNASGDCDEPAPGIDDCTFNRSGPRQRSLSASTAVGNVTFDVPANRTFDMRNASRGKHTFNIIGEACNVDAGDRTFTRPGPGRRSLSADTTMGNATFNMPNDRTFDRSNPSQRNRNRTFTKNDLLEANNTYRVNRELSPNEGDLSRGNQTFAVHGDRTYAKRDLFGGNNTFAVNKDHTRTERNLAVGNNRTYTADRNRTYTAEPAASCDDGTYDETDQTDFTEESCTPTDMSSAGGSGGGGFDLFDLILGRVPACGPAEDSFSATEDDVPFESYSDSEPPSGDSDILWITEDVLASTQNKTYNANATYNASPRGNPNATYVARPPDNCMANQTYTAGLSSNPNATFTAKPPDGCLANQTYTAGPSGNPNATFTARTPDNCMANQTYTARPPSNQNGTFTVRPPASCSANQTYTARPPSNPNATFTARPPDNCGANQTYTAGPPPNRNATFTARPPDNCGANQTYNAGPPPNPNATYIADRTFNASQQGDSSNVVWNPNEFENKCSTQLDLMCDAHQTSSDMVDSSIERNAGCVQNAMAPQRRYPHQRGATHSNTDDSRFPPLALPPRRDQRCAPPGRYSTSDTDDSRCRSAPYATPAAYSSPATPNSTFPRCDTCSGNLLSDTHFQKYGEAPQPSHVIGEHLPICQTCQDSFFDDTHAPCPENSEVVTPEDNRFVTCGQLHPQRQENQAAYQGSYQAKDGPCAMQKQPCSRYPPQNRPQQTTCSSDSSTEQSCAGPGGPIRGGFLNYINQMAQHQQNPCISSDFSTTEQSDLSCHPMQQQQQPNAFPVQMQPRRRECSTCEESDLTDPSMAAIPIAASTPRNYQDGPCPVHRTQTRQASSSECDNSRFRPLALPPKRPQHISMTDSDVTVPRRVPCPVHGQNIPRPQQACVDPEQRAPEKGPCPLHGTLDGMERTEYLSLGDLERKVGIPQGRRQINAQAANRTQNTACPTQRDENDFLTMSALRRHPGVIRPDPRQMPELMDRAQRERERFAQQQLDDEERRLAQREAEMAQQGELTLEDLIESWMDMDISTSKLTRSDISGFLDPPVLDRNRRRLQFRHPCKEEHLPEECKAEIERVQFDLLVKDQYSPGIIEDTIFGRENFNNASFDIVFGEDKSVDSEPPMIEPLSLLEAFHMRVDYEREAVEKRVYCCKIRNGQANASTPSDDCSTEFMIIDTYFITQHDTFLNAAIIALLKAEKIQALSDPRMGSRPMFDLELSKVETMLVNGMKLVAYLGVTKPKEP